MSTWVQKNTTHQNHRIRRIFRFDKRTPEFQAILRKQPEARKQKKEESKQSQAKKATIQ